MTAQPLPYAAISPNGRKNEWNVPLWQAIDTMAMFIGPPKRARRASDVIAVENAVEVAMRVVLDCMDDPAYLMARYPWVRDLYAQAWNCRAIPECGLTFDADSMQAPTCRFRKSGSESSPATEKKV